MKRALVLSFSPIASDPRVMRQLQALQGRFELVVAGFGPAPAGDLRFVELQPEGPSPFGKLVKAGVLLAGFNEFHYWRQPLVRRTQQALAGERFDIVIANDVIALPVALKIAGTAPVLLDAHEYAPSEFEDLWRWRVFLQRFYTHLCRRYLPQVAGMVTVCQGFSEGYRQFGVDAKVWLNAPAAQDLPVRPVDSNNIKLVHHGIAVPSRKLELMIEMMKRLDPRFTLDLMLVESDAAYARKLREVAAGDARIRFRAPVPMQQIASTINAHDIGVFLLPPVNFNYRMALPNKFFEFVQARLAVAIGPSPEMARLAHQYGFGIVTETFDPAEMARRLNALQASDIEALKQRADLASRELNAEAAQQALLEEVERLAG